jgi:hypothetical protein
MADRVGSIVVNGLVVAVLFILINRGFDNRAAIFFGVLAGLAVGLLVVWQHNRFDLYKFARRFASVMVAYEDEAGYDQPSAILHETPPGALVVTVDS